MTDKRSPVAFRLPRADEYRRCVKETISEPQTAFQTMWNEAKDATSSSNGPTIGGVARHYKQTTMPCTIESDAGRSAELSSILPSSP